MMPLSDNDISVDRAFYVRQLQQYLRTIQRYRTGSTLVPQDGLFGSRTTAAVEEFQRDAGLPVNGVVDRATWDAIFEAYVAVVEATASPTPIQGYQNPTIALGIGDSGDGVAFLQIMLRRLSLRHINIPAEQTISGVYTADTAAAVAVLQRLSGLPATGQVDKATWNAITALYNAQEAWRRE